LTFSVQLGAGRLRLCSTHAYACIRPSVVSRFSWLPPQHLYFTGHNADEEAVTCIIGG